eukprot:TRINITY_DN43085_c0_g1_i1.p2 TRINITY_DN43085_c0_g1~~TRINITY_DN43085_c0_g1_i1.p2  ORF type:complete len:185 (+),score=12.91 TRINITY_DN43085_c0_g1_i1:837-1391(+)
MSGSPLIYDGKAIAVLHGGPAVEGHHALHLAREKLKDAVNPEDIARIRLLVENTKFFWNLKDKAKGEMLKSKALAAFDKNESAGSIRRQLLEVYSELLTGHTADRISYNVFIDFNHEELQMFGECCSMALKRLAEAPRVVKYPTLDDFLVEHFEPFVFRKLRFGIKHPKIGVGLCYKKNRWNMK